MSVLPFSISKQATTFPKPSVVTLTYNNPRYVNRKQKHVALVCAADLLNVLRLLNLQKGTNISEFIEDGVSQTL